MTSRIVSIAVLALTMVPAAPALAQETFMAWGHEFIRPGSPAFSGAPTGSQLSTVVPRTYTATESSRRESVAPASRKRRY